MQCKVAKYIIEENKMNMKLAGKEFKINELSSDVAKKDALIKEKESEFSKIKNVN